MKLLNTHTESFKTKRVCQGEKLTHAVHSEMTGVHLLYIINKGVSEKGWKIENKTLQNEA